jgi:two-component system, cell cycle response regulator
VTQRGKPPSPDPRKTLPDPGRTMPDIVAMRVPGSSKPPRPDERKPVLVVLAGGQVGERVVIERAITIGRSPDNQLVLRDPAASWRHCTVEPREGVAVVRDLGSTHGTEVNGTRISAETTLAEDDELSIGDTILRLEIHDPVEQAFGQMVVERIARDDLTGLLSRRKFETDLDALVEEANLADEPLAVVMLDVDGVKRVNDRHGHVVGAHTIAEIGKLIGRVLGRRAICSRLGGDEYAIALPRTSDEAARAVVEHLLREVRALVIQHGDVTVQTTLSAGLAFRPGDGTDPAELMRVADGRLLRAKQSGRDRLA